MFLAREGTGGNEPSRQMSNPTPILETLQQFINADTWPESQAYLTQHPELLGDEVDALLGQLIGRAAGEERKRGVLQEHRDLLQRCREIGIEQGFEEKLGQIRAERIRSAGAELPSELRELVEDPQMRELLENPQLMGLMQDLFGALRESGTAPDDLETFLRGRPELMGGMGLGNLLNAESSDDALTQFWLQLLQAEMQSGGDEAAVHQVMRQNMGLIVPDLGDAIAQFVQRYLAQNPDKAEGIAGLVENTCTSIRLFPYGKYAEVQEIAIRGYGVVLDLGVYSPEGRAQTLTGLGNARSTQAEMGIKPDANLKSAIAAYDESAEILRRLELEKYLSDTLNNLGVAHNIQAKMGIKPDANLKSAIAAYDESAEILRRLGLEKDLSTTLTGLGVARNTQAEMGINPAANLESAIAAYDEAAEIRRRLGLEKDLSGTLNNLGNARSTQAEMGINPAANLESAIAAYDQAAEIRRRLKLEKDLFSTLNNLGVACYTQAQMGINPANHLDSAIAALDESAGIRRRLGLEKDLSSTLNNFGIARSTQAKMGINPAANLDGAITAYDESAEILRRLGLEKDLSGTLTNLGIARRAQAEMDINPAANLDGAIKAYDEAAEIRRRLGLARDLAQTLNNFGFVYRAQSRLAGNSATQKQQALEKAYRSFQGALERVEYLRGEIGADSEGYKRNFNEEWNKVYRGMVEVCLELGRYQDAIEYVDRSKARNLVELIATRDAYPGGVIPENIRQQLQSLKIAIAIEERRLQQGENPDPTRLNQLRQEKQELEPYKPLHFEGMQKLLDEETAILEWYILPDKFLTFTLTGQGTGNGEQNLNLWTSSKEDRQNLINWGENYLNDYRNRNNSQWRETLADRLAELPKILHLDEILSNLFKNFPTCQKLILIPHRYLHLFPLHALPITLEEGANLEGANIAPLHDPVGAQRLRPIPLRPIPLQDLFPKGITYAPNCQLLQQAQNRPRPHFNRLLAIQNPTNDLNWAEIEVETIRNIFPQRETLTRENARLATFLNKNLPQTHHLLFSCHGSFDPNSPLDSGLLLADGVLTLEQIIATLNLKECSLVTLSACETGQVALDNTDEYISIASGFLLAGSPSVLMSLWSVDEASTALLLIKTYETLNQHPGQLTTALQTAQTWLRETTNSGFYDWVQKSPLLDDHWRNLLAERFQREQNKEGANCRPYESPYHWAAFCIVGQGEQKNGTGQRQN